MLPSGQISFYCKNWQTDESRTWRMGKDGPATPEDIKIIKAEEQRRDEEYKKANGLVSDLVQRNHATYPDATDTHLYLVAKGVKAHTGLKVRPSDGALVMPLCDMAGKHWTNAYTDSFLTETDGNLEWKKRKERGGRSKGCMFIIGKEESPKTICVVEGYGQAASIHEAVGGMVVCTAGSTNMPQVCVELRAQYPNTTISICADKDHAGQEAAKKAAQAVGSHCVVRLPVFAEGQPGTDFNDMHKAQGLDAVRAVFRAEKGAQSADDEWAWLKDTEKRPSDKAAFEQLARLGRTEYDRKRSDAAKALGVRTTTLDTEVDFERAKNGVFAQAKKLLVVEDTEPCDDAVEDIGAVFDDIYDTIKKYIACSPEVRIACTLWIVHTWFIDHVDTSPIAMVTSPLKRCGKTRLLNLVLALSRRPLSASNITAAAIFRTVEEHSPTLGIDEADTFLKDEATRGILNSGHTKESAYVIRVEGDNHEVRRFSTWGAKIIAGIGPRAETLMDRSIEMKMRRRLKGESISKLRHADQGTFAVVRSKLARIAEDHGSSIAKACPVMPEALNDRAQDNWEPLFAIAELAGGEWSAKALVSALALSEDSKDGSTSLSEELLNDIHGILDGMPADGRIHSQTLQDELCKDATRPWVHFNNHQHAITQNQIADMLKPYKIVTKTMRIGEKQARGYLVSDFHGVFERYGSTHTEE